MVWTIVIVALLLGLIPASIARSKGQPFLFFWLMGALLFPIFLVVAIVMKSVRRRCPHCRETVQDDASVCPHCQRDLTPIAPTG
jgi:hypothetical protein